MIHFREELDELQKRLLEMAGLVESAIHQSIDALVQRDEQTAKEVLWKDQQGKVPENRYAVMFGGPPRAEVAPSVTAQQSAQPQQTFAQLTAPPKK